MIYDPAPCRDRGAALLDQHVQGWLYQMPADLRELDTRSSSRCVLAYVSGCQSYGAGADLVAPESVQSKQWAIQHGFDVPYLCDDGGSHEAFALLTASWRELILARRQTGA